MTSRTDPGTLTPATIFRTVVGYYNLAPPHSCDIAVRSLPFPESYVRWVQHPFHPAELSIYFGRRWYTRARWPKRMNWASSIRHR
jgi:hypothetical protein